MGADRTSLAARIQADKVSLNRLAGVAMNPRARAAIACLTAELHHIAVRLTGGFAADDLDVSLGLVERGVQAIEGSLRLTGCEARWEGAR